MDEKQAVKQKLYDVSRMRERDVRQPLIEAALLIGVDLPENADQQEMARVLNNWMAERSLEEFSQKPLSEASAMIMAI